MMKKQLLLYIVALLFTLQLLSAQYKVEFLYKDRYYNLGLYSTEAIKIAPFKAIGETDNSQVHRLILSSLERSKLNSLQYVGDSYEFNSVIIEKIYTEVYSIYDKDSKIRLNFSIGDYDSVVIHSAINFGDENFSIVDKMASAFTIKELLKKLTGQLAARPDLPSSFLQSEFTFNVVNSVKSLPLPEELEMYQFKLFFLDRLDGEEKRLLQSAYSEDQVNQLYRLKSKGLTFEEESSLKDIFGRLNVEFLYTMYYRRGNEYRLKYYIKPYEENRLRRLMDKVENVSDGSDIYRLEREELLNQFIRTLKTKSRDEVFDYLQQYVSLNIKVLPEKDVTTEWVKPYNLFYEKVGDYKSIASFYYYVLKNLDMGFELRPYILIPLQEKSRDRIQEQRLMNESELNRLAWQYSNIDSEYSGLNRKDSKKGDRGTGYRTIFNYELPDMKDAIFILAYKRGSRWIYTTGKNWVTDGGIRNPDWVCYHYSKKGCYYSYITKDLSFLEDKFFFTAKELEWELFLGN